MYMAMFVTGENTQYQNLESRMNKIQTYVYLRIPSNLDVQMMTLLSADPEANLFPSLA